MTDPGLVPGSGSRAAGALCGTGVILGFISPVVLTASTPALLAHHDLLLEALSSSAISIVTAGALASVGRVPLLLAVLAPLCGIALSDVFLWWAGQRWGERVVRGFTARTPRAQAWIERADRWVLRHGVRTLAVAYFLPIPNPLLYVSCGTAGMPLLLFVLGDAIGTLLWSSLLVGLGWTLGGRAVSVIDHIDRYELIVTGVLVTVLVAVRLIARRTR